MNWKFNSNVLRAVAGMLLYLAAAAASAEQGGLPWVGTWSAAPASEPFSLYGQQGGVPPLTFTQQTVRQYVFTSIGGTAARVHFSNQYGTAPLIISDVHLGSPDVNGNTIAGTDVAATFKGSASVTIPAGGTVTTDPININIPAAGYVAISAYFPQTTPVSTLTTHVFAYQTNQYGPGDVSGQSSVGAVGYPGQYFFLTSLDVQNANALGSVVALGASITDGMFQVNNSRWTNDLAANLAAAGLQIGVLNQGIAGGNMLTDNEPIYGDSALNRFNRDVLSQPGVRWVIYSEFDDLTLPYQQLVAGVQTMMNEAHQNNLRFICSTFTPVEATGAAEQNRQNYNAFIRTPGNGCDAVIDQDAAVRDPNNPNFMLPQYLDSAPGNFLHPSPAGDLAIANVIPLGILSQSTPLAAANPATTCVTGITSPHTLSIGATFSSCDKRFGLTLQDDGNLVLNQGLNTLWSSNTTGIKAVQGELLPTGNLILYDISGKPLWATNSDGHPGSTMYVQNDGNLVIYNAQGGSTWYSGTCCH